MVESNNFPSWISNFELAGRNGVKLIDKKALDEFLDDGL
jgi:hypothetical protein